MGLDSCLMYQPKAKLGCEWRIYQSTMRRRRGIDVGVHTYSVRTMRTSRSFAGTCPLAQCIADARLPTNSCPIRLQATYPLTMGTCPRYLVTCGAAYD